MDIDQLTAFERVVREGSFSRAALALNLAQPTLSARIQALEKAVGGQLLLRNNRRVALTGRGESFLPYARRALGVLSEGVAAAHRTEPGARGHLAVGCLHSLTGGLIGPVLADFQARYPKVICLIEDGMHDAVIHNLNDGVVEIGVVAWPTINPMQARLKPLLHFHEAVPFVAPKKHTLARMPEITTADVARLSNPFMLLRWWPTTPLSLERIAEEAASLVDVPMDTGRHLLSLGAGAGFFTKCYIDGELAAQRAVSLPVRGMSALYRDTALVQLQRSTALSAEAMEFVALTRQHAGRLGLLA